MRAQLEQEREQLDLLRQEVHRLSDERAQETIDARRRQQQQDQEVADLAQEVAKLRSKQLPQQHESSGNYSQDNNTPQQQQLQTLSDEVVRQRTKLSEYHSEIAALRARLQTALNRATVAEAAAYNHGNNNSSSSVDDDLERGRIMRRRKKANSAAPAPTMRMALLQFGDGPNGPRRVGQSLDAIDGFLTKSGKVLRYNPIVRLCFGESWSARPYSLETRCRMNCLFLGFCFTHTRLNRHVACCLSRNFYQCFIWYCYISGRLLSSCFTHTDLRLCTAISVRAH